jgi:hypothetical protein
VAGGGELGDEPLLQQRPWRGASRNEETDVAFLIAAVSNRDESPASIGKGIGIVAPQLARTRVDGGQTHRLAPTG